MKRELTLRLAAIARYDDDVDRELRPEEAADALDTIRALRAEMKRKDAALEEAVREFKQRNLSPWSACLACEDALRPLRKGKKS